MQSSKHYPSSVWVALGLVYLVWGSTYLAIRFAIQSIPPFFMAGARFLTSGLLLYGFLRLRGEPQPSRAHWRSAAVISFFLLVIGNGGVCWVEQKVPSGLTALLVGSVPLWMLLLEWAWKKGPRPGWKAWVGIALGFAGIAILVLPKAGVGEFKTDTPWTLLLLGTSFAWSLGSLYSRTVSMPSSALMATALEMIVGGLELLGTGFCLGEQDHFHLYQLTASSMEAWVYLTLVGALVGFTSYIWVLQKATPGLASTYAFVNPVIALFLGWFWAGEALSPSLFLAGSLIVMAVVLITLSPASPSPAVFQENGK